MITNSDLMDSDNNNDDNYDNWTMRTGMIMLMIFLWCYLSSLYSFISYIYWLKIYDTFVAKWLSHDKWYDFF